MAKISTYPDTPPPALDDFLLGTDVSNDNATQNFLVSDIVDLVQPYKVYTALLTQSGTDAPVAIVLENTIGNIVWTYGTTGEYFGTLINVFISDKTYFSALPSQGTQLKFVRSSVDVVNLGTIASLLKTNGLLNNTPIEIRVYN